MEEFVNMVCWRLNKDIFILVVVVGEDIFFIIFLVVSSVLDKLSCEVLDVGFGYVVNGVMLIIVDGVKKELLVKWLRLGVKFEDFGVFFKVIF